jgi:hypothetical protein
MCKDEHTEDTLESTSGEELPNIAITLKIKEISYSILL